MTVAIGKRKTYHGNYSACNERNELSPYISEILQRYSPQLMQPLMDPVFELVYSFSTKFSRKPFSSSSLATLRSPHCCGSCKSNIVVGNTFGNTSSGVSRPRYESFDEEIVPKILRIRLETVSLKLKLIVVQNNSLSLSRLITASMHLLSSTT